MALALLEKAAKRSLPPVIAEGLSVFPSSLGWMALVTAGDRVLRLSFGHATPREAAADVVCHSASERTVAERTAAVAERTAAVAERTAAVDFSAAADGLGSALQRRLQAYAEGAHDDFLDVTLDFGPLTLFQERVINRCRRIPPGQTMSYGALAEACGYPRAARAVGNCMRTNCIPLLVPCHRVVGAGGEVKGYSASDGVRMKLRLLELEKNGGSATLPISG